MILTSKHTDFSALYNSLYRYGYNGMEKDDEAFGEGNSYTTEFRQYDPRLGRWKSLDPLMMMFPWMSPYVAFDNNPVFYIDPYGLASTNGKGRLNRNQRKSRRKEDKLRRQKDKDDKGKGGGGSRDTPGGPNPKDKGGVPKEDDTYSPNGMPTNPKEGGVYSDDKGRKYMYFTDGEGVGAFYRLIQEATINPPKEKKSKSYGWLDGVSLDNLNLTTPRTVSPLHDDLKNQPDNVQREWMKNRANVAAVNDFLLKYAAASATAPYLIAQGVITAPLWAPHVVTAAKGYHNTFGMNGGYQNMALNYGYQSMSTGSLGIGNKDLISLGFSAFTRNSTPVWQQSAMGAVGGGVQFTIDEKFKIGQGSNAYLFGSSANGALTPILGNSRFGNGLSSTFIFGTFQLFNEVTEKNKK